MQRAAVVKCVRALETVMQRTRIHLVSSVGISMIMASRRNRAVVPTILIAICRPLSVFAMCRIDDMYHRPQITIIITMERASVV